MAKVSALNERTKKTIPIKKLVYTGMMTAITVVTSQIAFPLPSGIPVTLQTFSVSFCGYFGGFWGVAAVGVYLLLGLVGVPVFANFKGGFSALAGVTGGYLIGFLPMALFCAIPIKVKNSVLRMVLKVLLGLVGLMLCHLLGALWFGSFSGCGFQKAFLTASVPYLLKDVVSVAVGCLLSDLLKRRLKLDR